jgi:hypothetical protein
VLPSISRLISCVAIVFAYGCDHERTLGVAGEQQAGVFTARQIVGWYNSDPRYAKLHLSSPLSTVLTRARNAVIVGNGVLFTYRWCCMCDRWLESMQMHANQRALLWL